MSYYSWHLHSDKSNHSFLDCLSKPKDIIKKALELNLRGVCISDHASVSAYVEFLKERDKFKDSHPDFKISFGIEAYIIDESDYKNTRSFPHNILIAKDLVGLHQIWELSSISWKRSYFERGIRRIPVFYQDIEALEDKGHLIWCSACAGGPISKAILADDPKTAGKLLSWYVRNFGRENCFLELQPNDHSEEQKKINNALLKISAQTGLPYIITTDAHYLSKEDFATHQAFLNSREAKGFRETSPFYDYTYLMSDREIHEVMGNMGLTREQVQLGLDNTALIANLVTEFDPRQHIIIPQIKLPDFKVEGLFSEWYDEFPFLKKFATGDEPQNRFMVYSMEQHIKEKGYPLSRERAERLNVEFEVLDGISDFHKQPMSAYLNLVKRVVDIVWEVSPVMPGRGSCSGFLSCFYLGITQLDPIEYDLPWFRFLNLGRVDDICDIDIDVSAQMETRIVELLKKEFGEDCVLHTLTFKTESLKSAILTAARGLGLNNDEAQEMSALVPMKRGKMPSLEGVEKGDEEIDTPPVPQLIEKIRSHEGLYEAIERIQGVCSGIGIHASSLYIFQNGYLAQNALALAPNGAEVTAYNMHDSDDLGALKFDLLKTAPPQLFTKVIEYMVKDGRIEWQGSLRATWDKYLHPKNINYNDPALWRNISENRVLSLFQFGDSQVGSNTIRKVKPQSLVEMALANDVMRLQGDYDGESPTDRFVRYKYHYDQAITEMKQAGLTDDEIKVVEKYFGESYTVSCEQEQYMTFFKAPEVSNFSLRQMNNARKIFSKKLVNKIPELKETFFKQGRECGNREEFLEWAWKYLIYPQAGYGFSRNHSVPYSAIGAIEAMIVTDYSPLYWDAAVLSVQAGGEAEAENTLEEAIFGDEEEPTEEASEVEGEKSKKTNTTNYGKMARGIGQALDHGVKILLPNVNSAFMEFYPSVEKDAVIFGLGGVTGVNPDLANRIIAARPFASLVDFLTRINPTNVQAINMIKAGCFDSLYSPQTYRKAIMEEYVNWAAAQKVSRKEKLTMANLDKIIDFGLLPPNLEISRRVWKYSKFMKEHAYDKVNRRYIVDKSNTIKFFQDFYEDDLTIGKDYDTIPDGYSVKSAPFNKLTDKFLDELKGWLSSSEACDLFYKAELKQKHDEIWEKYCTGSVSRWEMQSLHYYYHEHELAHVNLAKYGIVDFETLPETLTPTGTKVNRNGEEVPTYDLVRICGTVINSDNNKHIVTILTNFGKVVDVKFYSGSYIYYNKVISYQDEKGVKHRVEGSWFDRGSLILLSGVRRELSFLPKTDWNKGYKHSVELITGVLDDGTLLLKEEREKL